MKTSLWLSYAAAISCLVVGLSKGIKPLLAFTGNTHTIIFTLGLLILGFSFAKTTGLFARRDSRVLDNDFDEEFHNDFSKVGSSTDIREVLPEDHTLGSKAQGLPSEFLKDVKKLEE